MAETWEDMAGQLTRVMMERDRLRAAAAIERKVEPDEVAKVILQWVNSGGFAALHNAQPRASDEDIAKDLAKWMEDNNYMLLTMGMSDVQFDGAKGEDQGVSADTQPPSNG